MTVPELIYVLTFRGLPLRAHTTMQGAAEAQAGFSPDCQQTMKVVSVRLVDDDDAA